MPSLKKTDHCPKCLYTLHVRKLRLPMQALNFLSGFIYFTEFSDFILFTYTEHIKYIKYITDQYRAK